MYHESDSIKASISQLKKYFFSPPRKFRIDLFGPVMNWRHTWRSSSDYRADSREWERRAAMASASPATRPPCSSSPSVVASGLFSGRGPCAATSRCAACSRGRDAPELLAALAPLEVDVGRPVAPGRLRAGVADVLALAGMTQHCGSQPALRRSSASASRPHMTQRFSLAPSYFFEVQQCPKLKVVLVVLLALDVGW